MNQSCRIWLPTNCWLIKSCWKNFRKFTEGRGLCRTALSIQHQIVNWGSMVACILQFDLHDVDSTKYRIYNSYAYIIAHRKLWLIGSNRTFLSLVQIIFYHLILSYLVFQHIYMYQEKYLTEIIIIGKIYKVNY